MVTYREDNFVTVHALRDPTHPFGLLHCYLLSTLSSEVSAILVHALCATDAH